MFLPQVILHGSLPQLLTSRHEGQFGSTGHEHRVEVRDGAGGDDVPSDGLGRTSRE